MHAIIDAPRDLSDYAQRLAAAGVRTVIRYYNNRNSKTHPTKCLTRPERDALFAAGLSVAVVFQQRGGAEGQIDDLSAANGARDGKRALDLATNAILQPKGTAIYFAVDWDYYKNSQLELVAAYFAAVKAELKGAYRIGVYGSGTVAAYLEARDLVDYVWLAGATGWSGTRDALKSGRWHLFQKHLELKSEIGGFIYDGNVANASHGEFGQFDANAPVWSEKAQGHENLFEVVARSGLNLRAGAGEQHRVIQSLPVGAVVSGHSEQNGWTLVDLEGDGLADGFMASAFLRAVSGGLPTHLFGPALLRPYDVARAELARGVMEVPGLKDSNPRIVMYHATTKGGAAPDQTAWCSSFVNYCVEKAGLIGADSKWALDWRTWGTDVSASPQEGDIVVFSRKSQTQSGGHVGFYESETASEVRVLGGNQDERVSSATYPKHGKKGSFDYKLLTIRRG
ncbi:hypothetical protein GCM10008171_18460 [Methylopila jiangsuensis]|uniref:N-acetylmuramoyl-L-alanine amidase n=1 Tax=Methylopila jiangsuensis TaxID=586230 RepID=A0A9W6JG30_9HYPH|nr:TIGR02594 family protein [Methylopila jiangsuensis]MDR6287105.1 uncharacterized protein (TIGR02594 family) [Methylopila jiangsuensis]GLK76592.1 hypothetical protein GCM10008171_18460 [Methylopila jiangsuensis]